MTDQKEDKGKTPSGGPSTNVDKAPVQSAEAVTKEKGRKDEGGALREEARAGDPGRGRTGDQMSQLPHHQKISHQAQPRSRMSDSNSNQNDARNKGNKGDKQDS